MTRKHTDCAGLSLLGLWIIGCGGSLPTGPGSTSLATAKNSSSLFTFLLPLQTGVQYQDHISSVRVTLHPSDGIGSDLTWTANAPTNRGTRIFTSEPPKGAKNGPYDLKIDYYSDPLAKGKLVATYEGSVTSNGNNTFSFNKLALPKYSVVAEPYINNDYRFDFGSSGPIAGGTYQTRIRVDRYNYLGNDKYEPAIFYTVPSHAVKYSILVGSSIASITPEGTLTTSLEGAIRVSATIGSRAYEKFFSVYAPSAQTSRTIQHKTNALDWESARGILWAAPAASDSVAQTVAAINPTNGAVTRTVPIGGVASTLTISPNGHSMWIGLEGSSAVRKMSLPGESLSAPISVPFPGITSRIGQIVVDPSDDDRIIVVHHDARDNHAILVVDHGTVVSASAPRGFTTAAWAGPNEIVAMGMFGNNQRFTYSPSGFVAGDTNVFSYGSGGAMGLEKGGKLTQIGNVLYSSLGSSFNAQSLSVDHGFAYNQSLSQAITGSTTRNRVYTFGSAYFGSDTISRPGEVKSVKLRSFELDSGRFLGSVAINIDTDYFRSYGWGYTPLPFPSVVPVGNSGVAFNTPTAIYIVDNAPG